LLPLIKTSPKPVVIDTDVSVENHDVLPQNS
jgi:hypothetical protein